MVPDVVPYRVDTERLTLRCWEPADAADLAEATIGHQEWFSFAPWVAQIQSVDEARAYARGSRGRFDLMRDFAFASCCRATARLMGGVQLHLTDPHTGRVTIDYWLRPDAAGQGYAREAVAAVVDLAVRRVRATRVEILVAVNNAKSRALPTALGFHKEGVMRESMRIADRPLDVVLYGLLGSEYLAAVGGRLEGGSNDGSSAPKPAAESSREESAVRAVASHG